MPTIVPVKNHKTKQHETVENEDESEMPVLTKEDNSALFGLQPYPSSPKPMFDIASAVTPPPTPPTPNISSVDNKDIVSACTNISESPKWKLIPGSDVQLDEIKTIPHCPQNRKQELTCTDRTFHVYPPLSCGERNETANHVYCTEEEIPDLVSKDDCTAIKPVKQIGSDTNNSEQHKHNNVIMCDGTNLVACASKRTATASSHTEILDNIHTNKVQNAYTSILRKGTEIAIEKNLPATQSSNGVLLTQDVQCIDQITNTIVTSAVEFNGQNDSAGQKLTDIPETLRQQNNQSLHYTNANADTETQIPMLYNYTLKTPPKKTDLPISVTNSDTLNSRLCSVAKTEETPPEPARGVKENQEMSFLSLLATAQNKLRNGRNNTNSNLIKTYGMTQSKTEHTVATRVPYNVLDVR